MNHFKLSEREVVVWLESSLWSFRGGNAERALSRKTPVPTAGSCWFLMHLKPSPPTSTASVCACWGKWRRTSEENTITNKKTKERRSASGCTEPGGDVSRTPLNTSQNSRRITRSSVGAVRDENLGGSEEWQITIWWWVNDTIMKTKHLTHRFVGGSAKVCLQDSL